MYKRWLLFVLFLIYGAWAHAQPLVKVTGTVFGIHEKPLSQVTISVLGQQASTLTDANGTYTIYSRTTSFVLKYSLLGYQPYLETIKEKAAGRIVKTISLMPNVNELEQVTITDKINQLTNTSTLNIADLNSLPLVSGNFESVLKTLPGVSTNNELSSQYSVRGGNFDENLTYVNDIEINRPILIRNGQQEGLTFINSDIVSRAKFSTGGFEARYADKLSSVLDVKYDRPDSNQMMLNAGFLGTSFALKRAGKDSYFLLGLRYKNNSGVLTTQENKGIYRPNYGDIQLLFNQDFSDKLSINVLGNVNKGQFNLMPEDRETTFGTMESQMRLRIAYNGKEIDDYETIGGAVSVIYSTQPHLITKWINSLFYTKERERFDIEGQYFFDQVKSDFTEVGLKSISTNRGIGTYLNYARNSLNSLIFSSELKTEYHLNSHAFSWGMRFERTQIDDRMSEYHLTDSAGYILPNNNKMFYLDQSINVYNKIGYNYFTAFIQDSYQLSTATDLQLGVRANYSDLSKQLILSPRLLLAYRPSGNDKLFRFTAGIYQQAPSYRSIRAYDGILNLNQKAQRSYNVSAGLDYAFDGLGTRLKFSSEIYYKYADRLIPYIFDNVRIKYLSTQEATGRTLGLDLNIGGEFVKDLVSYFRLSLMGANQDIKGDYYWTKDAKGKDQIVHPGYLKRPTDQRVNFSMFFQDRLVKGEGYKVHLTMLFGSRLPIGAPNSLRYTDNFHVPAYKRVDIGFSKDFLDDYNLKKSSFLNRYFTSCSVHFEVFNMLDINNTVSYLWLKDTDNVQYAVPNYLTGRQLNLKLILKFKN